MIVRAKRQTNYTIMSNVGLNDERLTFKAKGMLAHLLSKPDNWQVSDRQLSSVGPDGRAAVQAALKELEECGYLQRTRVRNDDGTFTWLSTIYDEPWLGYPATVHPATVHPATENRAKISTVVTSTIEQVKDTDANASAQQEVAPPLSAAQVFRNFHDELQNPKGNRAAILHRAYAYCYGDANVPDFGRIGTFAKRVGGAGMALTLMWEFLSRPPNGNVLDYLETTYKGRQSDRRKPYSKKGKRESRPGSYTDVSFDEPQRSYAAPADYAYAVAGREGGE